MEAQAPEVHKANIGELYPQLKAVSVFAASSQQDLECLGEVELVSAGKGTVLYENGDQKIYFWILLDGEVRAVKYEEDGTTTMLSTLASGESFGEVALLVGKGELHATCEALRPSRLIRIPEDGFWRLMSSCPFVRTLILKNMARRLQAYQALTVHRQKLISLGTLAAGLMHELNNPGAAARRAASQLRNDLKGLQETGLRFCAGILSAEQIECVRRLQDQMLNAPAAKSDGSLEQADKEECMAEWLDEVGVENGWQLAPTLTATGLTEADLQCALHSFSGHELDDTLRWLTSQASSMQLVGTIEESITRITELVGAVKKYSYDDRSKRHTVDIHDGLLSTLTILAHKMRYKDLRVEKDLAEGLPLIVTCGSGLNQVWTNLLDNAIDASEPKGVIRLRSWVEPGKVCVGIADQGSGIPAENRGHIFEPFFTTKPVGEGTGLGLDIAYRIAVGQYHGEISFTSQPGATEFIVRLPIETPDKKV